VLSWRLALERKVGLTPVVAEDQPRMKDGKSDATQGYHDTLEAHEKHLIIGYSAVKTGLELDNAIDGADVDGDRADSERCVDKTTIS
jgi:hypothetical protein